MSIPIKILVVVDSIDIDDSSGSKANVAFIQNLKKAGFGLKVYHYSRKKIQLDEIDCVSIKEIKFSLWYILSRLQRIFTRLTSININNSIESLFGFSFTFFNDVKSIQIALEKENEFHPSWILTLSKGGSFRPHKALLNIPNWHSRWLAYVHDPYPAHLYPRPYNWVEPGYYKKWFFFKEVSEKAKHGVFPSQLLKEWMGSYFPNFLEKGTVIPHQLNSHKLKNSALPQFFHENQFTLLHAGSLMKQRSPEHLLAAFDVFLEKFPEAKHESQLLLIGYNEYHKNLLDNYLNYSVVHIEGYLPYDTVYQLQQKAAVNIILESKSEISPFLPGKFPHCVEANRPILLLGPYYSESRRLLGSNYPYRSEVDDIETISRIIGEMYISWKDENTSFQLNRNDLIEYLSVENLKKTMNAL
ncbi:glycosyltransferase [Lutibacter sp. B1]|uniref:glycosyltransferase n=1 Tax=Lutibacter sp. B1 TaxID=2725996 RepID=UPI0014566FFA|nr:glycosyltransferase [Lutibacter sp. B1]NLP58162.1 glycosyltransferase [Lutibacter sp. B1]